MKRQIGLLAWLSPSVAYVLSTLVLSLSGIGANMVVANIIMMILSVFVNIKKDKFGMPRSLALRLVVYVIEVTVVIGGAFCFSFFPHYVGSAVYLENWVFTYCVVLMSMIIVLITLKYLPSMNILNKRVMMVASTLLSVVIMLLAMYTWKVAQAELKIEHENLTPVQVIKTTKISKMKEELDKFTLPELDDTYHGETPINAAIARGDIRPIKYLKKRGVNLNKRAIYRANAVNSTWGYFKEALLGATKYRTAEELNKENEIRKLKSKKNKVIGEFSGIKTKKVLMKARDNTSFFLVRYSLHFPLLLAIILAIKVYYNNYSLDYDVAAELEKAQSYINWVLIPTLVLSAICIAITILTDIKYEKLIKKAEGVKVLSKQRKQSLEDYKNTKTLILRIDDMLGGKTPNDIIKEMNELEKLKIEEFKEKVSKKKEKGSKEFEQRKEQVATQTKLGEDPVKIKSAFSVT